MQCILTRLFLTTILEVGIIIPTYEKTEEQKAKEACLKSCAAKVPKQDVKPGNVVLDPSMLHPTLLVLFLNARGPDTIRELQVARSTGEKLEMSLER